MSGTFWTLTPLGYWVISFAGVVHWWGVPSLIHGVSPPCRCRVARFWEKFSWIMPIVVGGTTVGTVFSVTWKFIASGTATTENMPLYSAGAKPVSIIRSLTCRLWAAVVWILMVLPLTRLTAAGIAM